MKQLVLIFGKINPTIQDKISDCNSLKLDMLNDPVFDKIPPICKDLNMEITISSDEGYLVVDDDGYGNPLTYCEPEEMALILLESKKLTDWDKNIIFFIRNLPDDVFLIPYWL